MSIVLKGVNMPKNCAECIMRYMAIGYEWECVFTNDNVENYDKKRLSNCPLSENPTPHGRLIDADRFIAVVRSAAGGDSVSVPLSAVITALQNAPTIIEAEDGDDQRDTDSQIA